MFHISMSTGWTLEYVGWNIDLPRLITMNKYWLNHPPMHILLAGYVGYKAPDPIEAPRTEKEQDEMLKQVMASLPKFTFKPPKVHIHGNEPRP